MQSFILQQNKARFLHLLQNEADDERRATLNGLLRAAERDLAFLQSLREGAGTTDRPRGQPAAFTPDPQIMAGFRETFGLSPKLCMALDAGPGLHIIEVNDAFVQESLHGREALVGKPLFSTFPDNPDDPAATGVSALYASLRMAVATGQGSTCSSWIASVKHMSHSDTGCRKLKWLLNQCVKGISTAPRAAELGCARLLLQRLVLVTRTCRRRTRRQAKQLLT